MPSPASTVTTVSTSLLSPSSSRASAKSTKSSRSRDRKASKKMQSLAIRSKTSPSKQPNSPPKIVYQTPFVREDVTLFNVNWTESNYLLVLIETKVPNMTDKAKEEFAALELRTQLTEVIRVHTPSEMKMVYMQICMMLSIEPCPDFFKSSVKGKDGLEEMIWDNREKLDGMWKQ